MHSIDKPETLALPIPVASYTETMACAVQGEFRVSYVNAGKRVCCA